ncbi:MULTISPECIES: hypothetical protein [Streptomycetaceae]|uniref:Uncharacterized protein n=1 Tax=Streptantibioticus cattleyicolor (strain ATCC 35852 / DSM 46488 / JCM 4925 / NBRC 14057 / NRRL 8057) TaxID=1003195 RepID=F8JWV6_STREN|nr:MULTISPECIES: hypothetical protein [Streptomycetaceae]AEW92996.1 hypothetical protein SCATT_06250 [Streptantibioticus cattleyicolor NRRL 8057 = DSM 46488]MYS57734.1 hypothetical protein [Streptomyces sp. SID5468]CCB73355.1 protein of unknown function [Streptantibioticus cattleyicolor NRRL 8057 = DSM 46488]
MKSYRALYGGKSATAMPVVYLGMPSAGITYQYFFVQLDKDPGYGPTSFGQIDRSQLAFLEPVPDPIPWWSTAPTNAS